MTTDTKEVNRASDAGRRTLAPILVFAAVLSLGACDAFDTLLEVEAPSRIDASTLEDPNNAALLVRSLISDFECSLSEYVVGAGLVGDELQDSQLAAAMWPYDQRQWEPSGGQYATATCQDNALGIYTPLSTARWQADNTFELLEQWTDEEVSGVGNRTDLMAQAAAYSGYAHTLMGEGMCSAAFDNGAEMQPPEVLARAESRFSDAIQLAQAAGNDEILNMARVGRARVRLRLGDASGAVGDAGQVPEDFEKLATFSGVDPRRENDVYTRNIQEGDVTVEADYRGLEFDGVSDPRVNATLQGISNSDNITELWYQDKYTAKTTPIPIATWDEAQLIIAEVEGGQTAVDIINAFHQRVGLPPFASTDEAEIRAHVLQERRRELFLESHHLGDILHYGLAVTPAPGEPYPPKAGGFYGDQLCFPLPEVETLNNPNIGGG